MGSPTRELALKEAARSTGGHKDDTGKVRWSLFPWDAALGIMRVMMFGAKKYTDRNWEKGMEWGRFYDAAIRHLTSWWARDPADPESGLSHLWHAGCCILFLIAYEIRGVGKDDRPATLLPSAQFIPSAFSNAPARPQWDRDHQYDPVPLGSKEDIIGY